MVLEPHLLQGPGTWKTVEKKVFISITCPQTEGVQTLAFAFILLKDHQEKLGKGRTANSP